ncbi:Ger(x)C family spore germination protein [Bacillus marinisedimentorum]|uniref:Ger(x)C family spore germination protein n=1 Tax=Bacillus marinisedimentorum TaxID=1821260 RepID=UPI000873131B|nr:Ger(x)C family spore germination protein [Bacillus marinisedimentorum]
MTRYRKIILIILAAAVFLTGCWNRRELNELAIGVAIGIDKQDEGYKFTAQIINPGKVAGKEAGGDSRTNVQTFIGEGKTLFDAWRNLTREAPRKMYFTHVQVVVIGEELAREGITRPLDPMLRDHEFRQDYYLLITSENQRAETAMNILTSLEEVPALKITGMLEASSKNNGVGTIYTLDEVVGDLVSDGKELALSGILVEGDPEEGETLSSLEQSNLSSKLLINELGIFKEDRLIGWLEAEDSKAYNYTQGNVKSTSEQIKCNDEGKGIISIEVLENNTKIKTEIKDNVPEAVINVDIKGNVANVECEKDLTDNKELEKLEKQFEKHTKKIIEHLIEIVQTKKKTDIIGIGEAVHKYNPKYWKKNKQKWEEIYPETKITVNVNASIQHIGATGKPPASGGGQ